MIIINTILQGEAGSTGPPGLSGEQGLLVSIHNTTTFVQFLVSWKNMWCHKLYEEGKVFCYKKKLTKFDFML